MKKGEEVGQGREAKEEVGGRKEGLEGIETDRSEELREGVKQKWCRR